MKAPPEFNGIKESYGHRAEMRAREDFDAIMGVAESPIEQRLIAELIDDGWLVRGLALEIDIEGVSYACMPQSPIFGTSYRADFVFGSDTSGFFVVELDGHDWHDRTKEQARHDRQRDRALLRLGLRTLRFTGSEVVSDARAVVSEIVGFLGLARGPRPPAPEETRQ